MALEAGNSATMIFRHYRELATEAEGDGLVRHSTRTLRGLQRGEAGAVSAPKDKAHKRLAYETGISGGYAVRKGPYMLSAAAWIFPPEPICNDEHYKKSHHPKRAFLQA